jgi:hypothetical protein
MKLKPPPCGVYICDDDDRFAVTLAAIIGDEEAQGALRKAEGNAPVTALSFPPENDSAPPEDRSPYEEATFRAMKKAVADDDKESLLAVVYAHNRGLPIPTLPARRPQLAEREPVSAEDRKPSVSAPAKSS